MNDYLKRKAYESNLDEIGLKFFYIPIVAVIQNSLSIYFMSGCYVISNH